MNFQLMPMTRDDIPAFKADIQEAFQKGFENVTDKPEVGGGNTDG